MKHAIHPLVSREVEKPVRGVSTTLDTNGIEL